MKRTDLTLSLQDMAELCIMIPSETATIIPVSKVKSAVKGMPRSFPLYSAVNTHVPPPTRVFVDLNTRNVRKNEKVHNHRNPQSNNTTRERG